MWAPPLDFPIDVPMHFDTFRAWWDLVARTDQKQSAM